MNVSFNLNTNTKPVPKTIEDLMIENNIKLSNDDKIKNLGWAPTCNFDKEIVKIVEYYKGNFVW